MDSVVGILTIKYIEYTKEHWEYADKSSSFQDLRDRDKSVTIHQMNIRYLASETCTFVQGFSPPILNEVFIERDWNYNLQGNSFLKRPRKTSVMYGTESVLLSASKN